MHHEQQDDRRTGLAGLAIVRRLAALAARPAAPGLLLILCTVLALVAANTPLADAYHHLFGTVVTVGIGGRELAKPLHFWINDGLMAIFFFVVGLEIKREILIGGLSSLKRAALPVAGAIGGMVIPAAIYAWFNAGGPASAGWAIPMATDIAFALGILSLLGDRVPASLKIFLTALAIVDDLGAVLVIALFYTDTIVILPLAIAGAAFLTALLLNKIDVRSPGWYVLLGVVVWGGLLGSGIHPTVAGVLMGFAIPVRRIYDGTAWMERLEDSLARYRRLLHIDIPSSDEELGARQEAVHAIEVATEKAQSPLVRLEHMLQPWVAFAIMPIFAFTNAGVTLDAAGFVAAGGSMATWGIFFGLLFGKQIGVFGASWLAVKLRLAAIPDGVRWKELYGVSILAGIGFTMSLFIAELSFGSEGAELLASAKIAIMAASLVAGAAGFFVLRRLGSGAGAASAA